MLPIKLPGVISVKETKWSPFNRTKFLLVTVAVTLIPWVGFISWQRAHPTKIVEILPKMITPFDPEVDSGIINIIKIRRGLLKTTS